MTAERLTASLADRYRIERELGAGGMATVYLAHDLKHDRPVALKVLRPELAETLGRERFLREIRLAARLNHPHILPLYDSGAEGDFLYFVMPVMQGQTLRDRLQQEKPLPVDDAVRIAIEVADALDCAHRHDIVHRDIKPENILLHEGHAIVADFGIGKALVAASADSATFTQIGVTVGTPAYMSPEQAAGEDIDGRSDLFALGCVLYEMLTGEQAFTGSTVPAVIARRFVYSPPTVTAMRPSVPPVVSLTVARLLEKAPADRYASGAKVVEALRSREAPASAPARDDTSLAVLPFTNMSADADNEYFADGLTEELIADLARVRALRVISRTSSMQLKGTTKGMRDIGRELGVRYALEGSVRKAGNSLRITAQLIDTSSDARLWGDKYNGTMEDVFDLQERVSRAIVDALDVTLGSEEDKRLTDRPITNVRAFELYLQARQEIAHYGVERGMALLNAAIEIEGRTPPLQGLEAWARVVRVRSGMSRNPKQELDAAEAAARSLLIQAPDSPYGHATLGLIGYERGQLADAVRHFRAALERAPNDADAFLHLCASYIGAGQNDAAAETASRFIECDPLSPVASMLAGIPTWFTGHPADGVPSLRKSVELDPESLIGRWSLAYNLALVGQLDEAMKHAEAMAAKAPDMPYTVQILALVEALSGQKARALERLAHVVGLDGHHKFHLAESFAMAGAGDRALDLLEEAVSQGFFPYPYLSEHCPFIASLRSAPRFAGIAARARRLTEEFRP